MKILSAIVRFFGRVLANLIAMGLYGIIFGCIVLILAFSYFSRDLPDYSTLETYNPPIVTRLYAADGKLMAEYATQKRVYVPLTGIPKTVIQAFLSAEDKDFYSHPGVDFRGLARAILQNLENYGEGRSMVGGSTITQQVVKNFLLSNEKTVTRKIREAILSFRITQTFSKDRILELYLNEIYLGQGSYGVAAAALNYFNKSLDELTVEEAAFLAALPKAPANYDPRFYYERAKARRDAGIMRMAEDGYITDAQARQYMQIPIMVRKRDATEIAQADFFSEEVRRELAQKYGSNILYEGGLYVKTTLDPMMQTWADNALRDALIAYDRRHGYRGPVRKITDMKTAQKQLLDFGKQAIPRYNGERLAVVTQVDNDKARIAFDDNGTAIIPLDEVKWARKKISSGQRGPQITKVTEVLTLGDVIVAKPVDVKQGVYGLQQIPEINGGLVALDPHSGRVLAMSGGYSYGGTEFNRVTQAWRQPGSAFKPFVYLTALENGFNPSSVVLDAPVSLSQGEGLPMWTPQNYKDEYLGPATLRVGLEKSRNTMTVRIAQALGIEKIMATAERFGIYDKTQRNFSVVLGAQETTLLRLANAYAMLVNGGKKVTPSLIERIDDRNGKTIFRRDTRICSNCHHEGDTMVLDANPPLPTDTREQILDPRVAFQITYMMQGVVERGTATKAKVIGKTLAGKTGTTNDSRDVWFIGFSPDLVAGIYVGFDQPHTLGGRETGGSTALPGFIDFMQHALENVPSKPFKAPSGIQFVKVNLKTGRPPYPDYFTGEVPAGPTILEAFKEGEDPGETPNSLQTDWGNGEFQTGPSEEQPDQGGWQPQQDERQRERWIQRYGTTGTGNARMPQGNPYDPESQQRYREPTPDRGGYGAPPSDRKPVNPDVGTGGLY
jgi:penicillin-binding protein 1A